MDKADEIRKRKGYARWTEFQRSLSLCNDVEDIMKATHNMLDDMNAYGSARGSVLGRESLQQVIQDCELDKFGVKYVDNRINVPEGIGPT